jgi:hypothetical protein
MPELPRHRTGDREDASSESTGANGLKYDPSDQRREPRFAAHGPCYLVLSGGAHDACARGSIVDASRSGLRVRSRFEALPGMNIEVFLHERIVVSGTVRHCSPNPDGSYDLGVRIEGRLDDDLFAGLLKI